MHSPCFGRSPAQIITGAILLFSLLPVPAFAAKSATIRLPDDFSAASTRLSFTGFGGKNRGHYSGAEFSGEYTRIESRLGIFDPLYVKHKGKSGFTIDDASGAPALTAECRAVEKTATYKIVTLDLKKLAYSCEFSGQDAIGPMRFVIGEPRREGFKAKFLARDLRTGEASILGHDFLINSVHEYTGSKITSQAPLGYLLESDGVVVGALDLLDWDPVVHLKDSTSESQRKATIIVALSLAVLRDPANSALEDF